MRANNIQLIVGFFLIVAIASFIGSAVADLDTTANILTAGSTPFEVLRGEGASDIAAKLHKDNIITSKFSFVTYAAITGAFRNLKPGLYALPVGNIPGIVRALTKGPQDVAVTLYPGMSVSEMDKKLYESGVIRRHELEKFAIEEKLEGFLMPDTYHFHQQSDVSVVVEKMRENFNAETRELFANMSEKEITRIVTIASLIEKEVSRVDDRRIVSGIIYKRLYNEYPLQIDASVAYGACEGVYTACETFSADSFKKDTPYNTYTRTGLPPHPIANPSVDAIKAALNPTQTDYYFYLTDRATGTTHFSATFEEHSKKRAQY